MRFQTLESRRVLAANPVITEFVASNSSGLKDGYGEDSDWIEIRNDGDAAVDLAGYHLTDDPNDLNQWEFATSRVLAPGEYLVVFASSRGLIDPAGNEHTNFSLSKSGGYLALTAPDQTVISEFGDDGVDYPPQVTNISYGIAGAELVGHRSVARYLVPTDDSLGLSWIENAFDAAANGFSLGRAAAGYENNTGSVTSYASQIETTVPAGTTNLYQRIQFEIDDSSQVNDLQLNLYYDDGVVVYLNGIEVVNQNAPTPLGYNTPAVADHPDTQVLAGFSFNLEAVAGLLVDGTNTLAIHALNRPGSSDFLIAPQLLSQSIAGETGYLTSPTPGAANALDLPLGPTVTDVQSTPELAVQNQSLTITANVSDFTSPLVPSSVRLHYRVMYQNEVEVVMTDDGQGADATAGDGVFSATVPAAVLNAGEMVRWRVTAEDTLGVETNEPRFLDAVDSAQYFGTVVADPGITTDLPVMQWFLENPSAASTNAGTRASLFTGGQFYDNINVNNHGQSTRGSAFPKKSFDFDANSGDKFRVRDDLDRVSDFNLLTNYADQTKLRHSLMYDLFAQADYAHHFAFSTVVYQNGSFYGLFDIVEEGDTEYLDRLGMDPDNPLYKVNNGLNNAYTNVEKKSREYEDHSDFQAVVNAAQNLSGAAARTWDFDHLDIADMVNYLAIHNVGSSSDFGHKNMYWYRDTNGTGLWSALPWDQDLSLGHQWDASVSPPYFKDDLVTDLNIYRGGNSVFQRLYANPTFREMYVRRVRTLADQFYGVPGSDATESYLAQHIIELEALIADEAIQDASLWGIHPNFTHTPAEAADQLIDEFIPLRRSFLDNHADVPSSQSGAPTLSFDDVDYDADPLSGLQSEEYVRLNNPNGFSVDLSGWRLDGGIDHTFKGGTVLPAGGALYVVKDVVAFLNRTSGPGGGQDLFIQGNYNGQLTFNGETVELIAADGTLVDTLQTPVGAPTFNQQFLRITEIQYNPLVDDTEFIEFANISHSAVPTTLDLAGVTITDGPSSPFVFPAGTTLAPGERLLVVQDSDAFQAAYPAVDANSIAGVYLGNLSNGGEQLKVIDAGGETIVDLEYGDSDPWPMSADGTGASLVLEDPAGTPLNRLAKPYSWRGSAEPGGTPASVTANLRGVVINELLTHTDPPQSDAIELYNPTDNDIPIGGWFLSDSANHLLKFKIPAGTVLVSGGYLTFDESDFNPTPENPGPNDFALSGSQGDEVWLVIADPLGNTVIEMVDQVSIGATFNGQSFGRVPNGQGRLAPLQSPSLGFPNGPHQTAEVLISEIHYHPSEPSPADLLLAPEMTSQDLEFVEIHHWGTETKNLTNWRLRGDVDFDFPAGTLLAENGRLVLVSFDPASPTDANRVAAFRNHFGIDPSVPLAGPFSSSLGNSFGRVELQQPDDAPADDPTVMPRVTIDEVVYDDLAPWPTAADGDGQSLQRISESAYGNAADSWYAAVPTPGMLGYRPAVESITINDGQDQRSSLTSIHATFDRLVDLDPSNVQLVRRSDGQIVSGLLISTSAVSGKTIAQMTFDESADVVSRDSGNSLVDGYYELRISGDAVHASEGGTSMLSAAEFGNSANDRFFRYFGDGDGDGDVDGQDAVRIAMTFLQPLASSSFDAAYDFDGDGDVDSLDYAQFSRRSMRVIKW
ncbi:lamin tail domain-containing protein [Stieleria sp. TO1_6]|uniref:lamin tail domain-containing protein n=1 Tax=Stieleria tagensis TaxID=2956795 RepID=UPI00209ABCA0|nr:lamin tail domain-containing protein [Stieleria tagensis]MCO8120624.1 lamin tail domain-containing protein [Stieleria tagensis]